jgi:hypothetical protein
MDQKLSTQFDHMSTAIGFYADFYFDKENGYPAQQTEGGTFLESTDSLVKVIEKLNDILERNQDEKNDIANALIHVKILFRYIIEHLSGKDRDVRRLQTELRELKQSMQPLPPIGPDDLSFGGKRKTKKNKKIFSQRNLN